MDRLSITCPVDLNMIQVASATCLILHGGKMYKMRHTIPIKKEYFTRFDKPLMDKHDRPHQGFRLVAILNLLR